MLLNSPSVGSITLLQSSIQPETFMKFVGILHSCCICYSPIFTCNGSSGSKVAGEQRGALKPLAHPDCMITESWSPRETRQKQIIMSSLYVSKSK